MKIEKGIPIPGPQGIKEFVKLLEIGDSFVIESDAIQRTRATALRYDISVLTRKISDTHHRVWRIEGKKKV